MLTPNLLTLQGCYFWKDVAFWNIFSNDSIKAMVSFSLGLDILFFILPYGTRKIKLSWIKCLCHQKKSLGFDVA